MTRLEHSRDPFSDISGGLGAGPFEYNSVYEHLMAKDESFSRAVGDPCWMSLFGEQPQQRKMTTGGGDNEKELPKAIYGAENGDSLSPLSFGKESFNDSPTSSGVFSTTSSTYSMQSLGGNTMDRNEFSFDLPVNPATKTSVCLLLCFLVELN